MNKLVYVLDDDSSIGELVKFSLEMNGISCIHCATIAELYNNMDNCVPNIVILDIMLPDGNGLDVMKNIKASTPEVWCIMLSALGQEIDKVKGLNNGADEYIAKPFGVLELVARVNAVFRRNTPPTLIKEGDYVIDDNAMTISLAGRELDINNKEYQLIKYMVQNHGKVLSRESLLNHVWGYDSGETRTLDNHIARIRKLGVTIETVFGIGYKLKLK